jgi:hypothetical protein
VGSAKYEMARLSRHELSFTGLSGRTIVREGIVCGEAVRAACRTRSQLHSEYKPRDVQQHQMKT